MIIHTDQINIAARGLYALHVAQFGHKPGRDFCFNFEELPEFEQGKYYAKGERVLYDLAYSDCRLGPKAVERLFQ